MKKTTKEYLIGGVLFLNVIVAITVWWYVGG